MIWPSRCSIPNRSAARRASCQLARPLHSRDQWSRWFTPIRAQITRILALSAINIATCAWFTRFRPRVNLGASKCRFSRGKGTRRVDSGLQNAEIGLWCKPRLCSPSLEGKQGACRPHASPFQLVKDPQHRHHLQSPRNRSHVNTSVNITTISCGPCVADLLQVVVKAQRRGIPALGG